MLNSTDTCEELRKLFMRFRDTVRTLFSLAESYAK